MPFELHFKEIIRKRGNKYVVLSKDGKKLLGTHDTKKDALAQLKAIEISKSRGKNKMNTNERINKLHEKIKENNEESVEDFKERILKEQNDPARICGFLWFDGTDKQRSAFGKGTEGRGRDEKPPKAWFDDCTSTIGKAK